MPLKFVSTAGAPKAIGPYSQATITDGLIFTAGQIALDPATGEIVAGGVTEQTERVFANLRAILRAAGADLGSVVKATVFLTDMNDFKAMNAVYAEAFGDHRPARSTVAVAALPRGVAVEIDVIARRGR
jgi:2-iminobutanoate/2-iminopropanoate deaminase